MNSTTADSTLKSKPRTGMEHRWSFREYQRMLDAGFFFRRRVELIGGKIIDAPEQSPHHAVAIGLIQQAVSKAFDSDYWPRILSPLYVDQHSLVFPDFAIIEGSVQNRSAYRIPNSALLIIEVSDTSLRYDRQKKSPRYASAGYADYWIVNLIDNCVEIYRKPVADPSARLGWRYSEVSILKPPASITPLAASNSILIADLLPLSPTS